jgi:hypothetical protein
MPGEDGNTENATAEANLVDRWSALDQGSRTQLVVLRLLDNLEDKVPGHFPDAKSFRALFPVTKLPSVSILTSPFVGIVPCFSIRVWKHADLPQDHIVD